MKKLLLAILLSMFMVSTVFSADVVIGDEESRSDFHMPFSNGYKFSWSHFILPVTEETIPLGTQINKLEFNVAGTNDRGAVRTNQTVYLKLTDQNTVTKTFPSTEGFTQVYTGTISWNNDQWQGIKLHAPFIYEEGKNIEVIWKDNHGTAVVNLFFRKTSASSAGAHDYTNIASNGNAEFSVNGNLENYYPNTRISWKVSGEPEKPILVAPLNGVKNLHRNIDFIWETGEDTDYTILTYADNPDFTNATTVQSATSPHSVSLAGLTKYYWKVKAVKTGEGENTSDVSSFTTEYGRAELPYNEDFENAPYNSVPFGWTRLNDLGYGSNNELKVISNSYWSHSGDSCLNMYNSNSVSGNLIASTPRVLNDNVGLQFYAKTDRTAHLVVGTMTDTMDANTFTTLATYELTPNYLPYLVALPPVEEGNTEEVYFSFKHGMTGAYNYIYIDDVAIDVLPNNSVVTINPNSYDFGYVAIGEQVTETLLVSNMGGVTAVIDNITNLPGYTVETVVEFPYYLLSGNSFSIEVTFAPTEVADYSGTLMVEENFATHLEQYELALSGSGYYTEQQSEVEITPAGHDFGEVALDSEVSQTFTVANSGTVAFNISEIFLPEGYSYDETAIAFPYNFAVGATFDLEVTFAPTSIGNHSGHLTIIEDNHVSEFYHEVELNGMGFIDYQGAPVTITPNGYGFGEVLINQTATQDFTLTNNSEADFRIDQITLLEEGYSYDYPPEFPSFIAETPDELSVTIVPGQSYTFTVTFSPTRIANYGAKLSVLEDHDTHVEALEVWLSGRGYSDFYGDDFSNPIELTFPVENLDGNLDGYASSCDSQCFNIPNWEIVDLGGKDIIYHFSLEQEAQLNGTITVSEYDAWILSALIFQDIPTDFSPAEVLLFKPLYYQAEGDGGGPRDYVYPDEGTTIHFNNELLPAGSYYLMIAGSQRSSNLSYIMNLTADPLSPPLAATIPRPADGTTGTKLTVWLEWEGNNLATGYKVFYSDQNSFTGAEPIDVTNSDYLVSNLEYATTYYWKVIPYNDLGDCQEEITVWSFTTMNDPFVEMPIFINFENIVVNSDQLPPAINFTDMKIGHHPEAAGKIMNKVVSGPPSEGQLQFHPIANIPADARLAFDYRFVTFYGFGVFKGYELLDHNNYLVISVCNNEDYDFEPIAYINSTNHTPQLEFRPFVVDLSAYAGQRIIIKMYLNTDHDQTSSNMNRFDFQMDNIFLGGSSIAPTSTQSVVPVGADPGPVTVTFNAVGVELDFANPTGDFAINVVKNPVAPEDEATTLPDTAESFLPCHWGINTSNDGHGGYSVTFDLGGIEITDTASIKFFKRANSAEPWLDVVADLGATLSWNGTKVTISGLDSFSEFAPALAKDDTLPVTLASFLAIQTAENFAKLTWITHSESAMIGYNILRNEEEDEDTAIRINKEFIAANNVSTSSTYTYIDNETELNVTYYYWLQSNDLAGASELFGPVKIKIGEDNDTPELVLPTKSGLQQIYPNPFNPSTTVSFYLTEAGNVKLKVYNIKGQLINEVIRGSYEKGFHNVVWNGKDAKGQDCSSGLYFFRMETTAGSQVLKGILMK